MAAYVGMLVAYFPDIAGHLLAASVMSAPAAIVISKVMYPEDGVPETAEGWEQLIGLLRQDRIAQRSLVSLDERVFALNLILDENVDSDRAGTVAEVRALLSGRRAWVSGVPVLLARERGHRASALACDLPRSAAPADQR